MSFWPAKISKNISVLIYVKKHNLVRNMLKIFEMQKRSLEQYSGNREKVRKLELLVNKIALQPDISYLLLSHKEGSLEDSHNYF